MTKKVRFVDDNGVDTALETNPWTPPTPPRRKTEKELVSRAFSLLKKKDKKIQILKLYNALESGGQLQPLDEDLLFKVKLAFSDQIMNELSSKQIFNEAQMRILENLKSKLHDTIVDIVM